MEWLATRRIQNNWMSAIMQLSLTHSLTHTYTMSNWVEIYLTDASCMSTNNLESPGAEWLRN